MEKAEGVEEQEPPKASQRSGKGRNSGEKGELLDISIVLENDEKDEV